MAKFLLSLAFVLVAQQGSAIKPPVVLPSRPFVAWAKLMSVPYDTSYLNLPKRAQLWRIFTDEVQEQYWIEDLAELRGLINSGELVEVSEIAREVAIILRKSGRWPIAERDYSNREYYYYLRPEAVGAMILVGKRLQECGCDPVESTSLVRTWVYQKQLMKVNPTANVTKLNVPPTHIFALVFDLSRKTMSAHCQKLLEDYLKKLTSEGKIIYFKESSPQAAFHIIALPQAQAEFTSIYQSAAANIATGADGSR